MENKLPIAYVLSIFLSFSLFLTPNSAFADRFDDDCKVPWPCPPLPPAESNGLLALTPLSTEPHQRAIVIWNGIAERLILSTDLARHPSKPQPRLESLPLPTRPTVSKRDLEIFTNLATLAASKGKDLSGLAAFAAPGSMDENFDVQEFESLPSLLEYVNQSLTQIYGEPSRLDSNTAELHGEYLKRGFHYLVFDRITVTEEVRTFPPVEYRFATMQGYYPLGDSLSQQGSTQADVIMITPRPVHLSGQPVQLLDAFQATAAELASIDPSFDWAAFMGNSLMYVQHARVAGKLSELRQDIVADFQ